MSKSFWTVEDERRAKKVLEGHIVSKVPREAHPGPPLYYRGLLYARNPTEKEIKYFALEHEHTIIIGVGSGIEQPDREPVLIWPSHIQLLNVQWRAVTYHLSFQEQMKQGRNSWILIEQLSRQTCPLCRPIP